MELEWMGRYRELMQKLTKYGNAYAQNSNREMDLGFGESFSPSQIQVMEYILENGDDNQNMAQIAARMGVPPSSFSKLVTKMVQKGLLEKYHTTQNRKNIIIRVSPAGLEVYRRYAASMQPVLQSLAALWDRVPDEALTVFTDSLELMSRYNRAITAKAEVPPTLVPAGPPRRELGEGK